MISHGSVSRVVLSVHSSVHSVVVTWVTRTESYEDLFPYILIPTLPIYIVPLPTDAKQLSFEDLLKHAHSRKTQTVALLDKCSANQPLLWQHPLLWVR